MPSSDASISQISSSSTAPNSTTIDQSPPPPSGTPSSSSAAANRSSWFSDFRAKINQFNASDFFANLGFKQHQNLDSTPNGGRKASLKGGTINAPSSRSVMNLTTSSVDESTLNRRKIETLDQRLLSTTRPGMDLASSSSRHHSDEPRRRLFVNNKSTDNDNQSASTTDEPIWRLKQKSEPPDFGHHPEDDEERPSPFVPSDYDSATITLDKINVDLSESNSAICGGTGDIQRFGTLTGLIVSGKVDPGVGHGFETAPTGYPTWCDKCGDFISGLYDGQAVRCKNCRFTCHVLCQPLVTLDCRSSTNSLKSEASSSTTTDRLPSEEKETITSTNDDRTTTDAQKTPSENDQESLIGTEITELADVDPEEIGEIVDEIVSDDQLQRDLPHGDKLNRLIDEYNKNMADGLAMSLEEDGITFRGFLQIHMNFSRPINVIAGEHPPTIYDVLVSENDSDTTPTTAMDCSSTSADGRKTITSFYLPRNTVKVLHITSETTTSEMIVSLLRKFKVADNPRKFALYERDLEPGKTLQARLLRIPEEVCPLRLALFWGCKRKSARFVLQENETGDIMWDAFEIPELQNFLKILEIEEGQYKKQIEHRYHVYRYWLEAEIRHRMAIRASIERQQQPVEDVRSVELDEEGAVEV